MLSRKAQIKNVKNEVYGHNKIRGYADRSEYFAGYFADAKAKTVPHSEHKESHCRTPKQAVREADVSPKIHKAFAVVPKRQTDDLTEKRAYDKLHNTCEN